MLSTIPGVDDYQKDHTIEIWKHLQEPKDGPSIGSLNGFKHKVIVWIGTMIMSNTSNTLKPIMTTSSPSSTDLVMLGTMIKPNSSWCPYIVNWCQWWVINTENQSEHSSTECVVSWSHIMIMCHNVDEVDRSPRSYIIVTAPEVDPVETLAGFLIY